MDSVGVMKHVQTNALKGNPLDIVSHGDGACIVSIDCVFEPGSTSKIKQVPDNEIQMLQAFRKVSEAWSEEDVALASANGADLNEGEMQGLSTLFYSLENLRKRGDEE